MKALWLRLLSRFKRPSRPGVGSPRPPAVRMPLPVSGDDLPAETDSLFENTLAGYIRHRGAEGQVWWYSARTRDAILTALTFPTDVWSLRQVHYYARMTASTAFALHPELREPAPPRPVLVSRTFRTAERVH